MAASASRRAATTAAWWSDDDDVTSRWWAGQDEAATAPWWVDEIERPRHPHVVGRRPQSAPAAGRDRTRPQDGTRPVRTRPASLGRWWTLEWWLRDTGLAAALAVAVAAAWIVLVVLRVPQPRAVADQLTIHLDGAVAQTLRADRIAAFVAWIVNVATTLVVGGFIFRTFVSRPRDRALPWSPAGLLRAAAVVGSLASLAVLPFRMAAVAGTGSVALADPAALHFILTTRFGNAVLLRIAGLLMTTFAVTEPPAGPRAVATGRSGPGRRGWQRPAPGTIANLVLGVTGVLLVLASYALVGHPQATSAPGPLLVLSQSVHILAVATWFGGVTLLFLQIRAGRRAGAVRTSAELVARFSTVAGLSVAVATATGVALARSQIHAVQALTTTPYGRALVLKLVFVAIVLAIGGYNKHWVVPRIAERRGPAAWRSLHRTLLGETFVIIAGVLLATTAMISGGI